MKVRQALADAERRLAAIPGSPRQDAELLMAAALGAEMSGLHLRHLDDPVPAVFEVLLQRRLAREPIAYITGRAGFWTIELEVGPGVLIPRADTETLIEAAVDHFGKAGPGRVLDLGTGPGTLLLAALDQWRQATGIGVDRSQEALAFAGRNAAMLGMSDRADFRLGDWDAGLDGPFDLILCNPPYIEDDAVLDPDVVLHEPAGALFAGADGLDDYRRLAPAIARLIAPDGLAALEIGMGQEAAVSALFVAAGFTVKSRADARGVARCLELRADGTSG